MAERAAGCFICRPDDPAADPEGCASCEASYVRSVVLPDAVGAGRITAEEAEEIGRELESANS